MKNVTLSMDEELLARTRVAAAKQGMSMSRFMANLLRETLDKPESAGMNASNPQYEALQRILAGPKWNVTENGRMPTSDERNAR